MSAPQGPIPGPKPGRSPGPKPGKGKGKGVGQSQAGKGEGQAAGHGRLASKLGAGRSAGDWGKWAGKQAAQWSIRIGSAIASGGTSLLVELKWLLIKLGIVLGLVLTTIIFGASFLMFLGMGAQAQTGCAPNVQVAANGNLMALYQGAATQYGLGQRGVWILAAINGIESGFGRNLGPSSAGARGWMQFMPGTWALYGVDANRDGKADWDDPADAIYSAANYLHASGAPSDWHKAIFTYNHSEKYVRNVLSRADRYERAGTVDDMPSTAGGATPVSYGQPAAAPGARTVAATIFSDAHGYRSDDLRQKPDTYAELGGRTESAANLLGGLPYMTPLVVTNPKTGQSLTLYKRDFGYGQGSKTLQGHRFAIDIWQEPARQLGLTGSDLVTVQPGDTTAQTAGLPMECQSPTGTGIGGARRVDFGGTWLVPVPGFPGERCDQRILPDVLYLVQRYKITVNDCYGFGGDRGGPHSTSGEHPLGVALDASPKDGNWNNVDQMAADLGWRRSCGGNGCIGAPTLNGALRGIFYDGYPGHGRGDHIHISWKHADAAPYTPPAWVMVFSPDAQGV